MFIEGLDVEVVRNVVMYLSVMNFEYIFVEDILGSVLEKFVLEFKELVGFSDKFEKI